MTGHSGHTANAFAFFANAKAGQKNAKELPSQRTGNSSNLTRQTFDKRKPLPITAPTQKAGFRVPKTVLWLIN
jgi:hypothetical protein